MLLVSLREVFGACVYLLWLLAPNLLRQPSFMGVKLFLVWLIGDFFVLLPPILFVLKAWVFSVNYIAVALN